MGVECSVLLFLFVVSYMMYPSIVFKGSGSLVQGRKDWSLFLVTMSFNLSDFFGRCLAQLIPRYATPALIAGALIRLALVGTTFAIALAGADSTFWRSNATVLVNACLLGISKGFLATATCSSIPGKLAGHEKEFGGLVMSVMINGGIFLGSLISLLGFSHIFDK